MGCISFILFFLKNNVPLLSGEKVDLLFILKGIIEVLERPVVFLFLSVGIILTIKTGFLQLRAFPKFVKFLREGGRKAGGNIKTINPIHALFAGLSTTIGMGNIVGPSIAIMLGGPGALFWMISFAFFAGILKFTEVSFAIHTRKKMPTGELISGPTQYLKLIHSWLANWYGAIIVIVFAVWNGVQSNVLASVFAEESVPKWLTGFVLAFLAILVVSGGAKRVGLLASRLMPVMCLSYVAFAALLLFRDMGALYNAFSLVFSSAFSLKCGAAGFFGAMSAGIFKSIYSTEAGMGTTSIPHSFSDVQDPTNQGVLAMYGIVADAFIGLVSGLLILVTGIWLKVGDNPNILVYKVFKANSPTLGHFVLMASIGLFVLTTIIGNTFSGSHSFASMTKHRLVWLYQLFMVIMIFGGSFVSAPLVWKIIDILIILVAVPNVIGLLILAFKKPEVLEI